MTTPEISKVIKLIIVNSLLVSISSGIIGSFAFFSIRKKRMAEATIIISNPNTGEWDLILMIYLNYVTFDERINYSHDYSEKTF